MTARAKRATIVDVAHRAEVSTSTVSRVLNDRPVADHALIARVRTAAAELDYRPNTVARDFRRGRTSTIGVVVPDLANPYFPHLLKGLAAHAGEGDHRLLVVDSDEDVEVEERLVLELAGRCDGMVLCSPRMPARSLRDVVDLGLPVLCTNRTVPGLGLGAVAIDSGVGMAEAIEHLAQLGHRSVGYLAGPASSWSDRMRRKALGSAASRHRIEIMTVSAGSTSAAGYATVPRVLEAGATAAIAFNDLVAVGALARLRDLRIDVPAEFSVVGCDDIPTAAFLGPPLTTVHLPQEELGRRAWVLLERQMRLGGPAEEEWLTSSLVVRESTAAASDARR